MTYLVATRSSGKLRELRALFARALVTRDLVTRDLVTRDLVTPDLVTPDLVTPDLVRVIDLSEAGIPESDAEEGIEIFETFEENARAKSEYFHRLSGLPVFADDSGLVVHPLGGVPGVRSKRWSGRTDLSGHALDEANNAKLVAALRGLSDSEVHPAAEYVCAAAFTDGEGSVVCLGRTSGYMTTEPVGAQGFGYDPYFHSRELGKSFGEASTEEKLGVSHRGRGFEALLGVLRTSGRILG